MTGSAGNGAGAGAAGSGTGTGVGKASPDWLLAVIRATCAAGRSSPEDVAEVLGVAIRPGYRGYAEVAPLPDGVDQMLFGLDEDRGPVRFVSVLLTQASAIPLSALEPGLADGRETPPRHPGDADRVLYDFGGPAPGCRIAVDLRPADPYAGEGAARLVASVTILP